MRTVGTQHLSVDVCHVGPGLCFHSQQSNNRNYTSCREAEFIPAGQAQLSNRIYTVYTQGESFYLFQVTNTYFSSNLCIHTNISKIQARERPSLLNTYILPDPCLTLKLRSPVTDPSNHLCAAFSEKAWENPSALQCNLKVNTFSFSWPILSLTKTQYQVTQKTYLL